MKEDGKSLIKSMINRIVNTAQNQGRNNSSHKHTWMVANVHQET